MDATLAGTLTTSLTAIKDGAIATLVSNAPIALTGVVSVAVLFFGIKTFRAILHV